MIKCEEIAKTISDNQDKIDVLVEETKKLSTDLQRGIGDATVEIKGDQLEIRTWNGETSAWNFNTFSFGDALKLAKWINDMVMPGVTLKDNYNLKFEAIDCEGTPIDQKATDYEIKSVSCWPPPINSLSCHNGHIFCCECDMCISLNEDELLKFTPPAVLHIECTNNILTCECEDCLRRRRP